ncbi:MAG: class I SAM-dependent methyltransferase [Candidatus Krumholzibacteriota bacterium]|nr:class I SAM-dependent methyltransferase [Candidatus Krumholzibacteriota bacterium]
MIESKIENILACPVCHTALTGTWSAYGCGVCGKEFDAGGGILSALVDSGRLTVDPGGIRIKDDREAGDTIREMKSIDYGFITKTKAFYFVYLFLFISIVLRIWPGTLTLALILLTDWIVFRIKRGRALRSYVANPLRLRTVSDYRSIDGLYEARGLRQPTMLDWVRMSGSGGDPAREASNLDDERYEDIAAVVDRLPEQPRIIVDVGANDGRACYHTGIGKDQSFIGVDISRLLLEEFKRKLPGQTAILADGASLPLKDDSIDFLFCTETLEHLSDPGRAVGEFMRVLRPGGSMMIQSPNAHRVRNLNIFHLATLMLSLVSDSILQKKIVHENTWHNACTYHWDFSISDYRRFIGQNGGSVRTLSSSAFFFPPFLLRGRKGLYRKKEKIFSSIPFLRYFGGDLVVVAEKKIR